MRKYLLYTTAVAATCISLISCQKPKAFDYRDVRNFSINKLGFDKSAISMDLVYFNPNNFGVNLRKVDCDIWVDDNYVGKFNLDTLLFIPKKAEFTLPAHINVDMRNLFKNTLNILFAKEVNVRAKGTTRVGKGGIFINVPFDYKGKHEVDLY